MIGEFFTWWWEQMLQWLPARLAARDAPAAHGLILKVREIDSALNDVAAALRRRGRERPLGRFGLDHAGLIGLRNAIPFRARPPIVLALPAAWLLEREVVLPIAAERDPGRFLAYDMDRITPFASDDLFWTYAVARRDRARGRIHLRLSIVTRAAVEGVLSILTQASLPPTALEFDAPDGPPRHIALRRPDSRRERFMRRATVVAAGACVVLVVALVALPFVIQSLEMRRVEKRIDALRPRVAEAEALRKRIAASNAGVDVVAAERARVGDALWVLAAVTDLLPDDTSLAEFTLRQGKLMMNGQSSAAVRLIAALSGDPVIRNPEFVAPVTRMENRTEVFAIGAEVAR